MDDVDTEFITTRDSKSFWKIYISRALSNWGDRLWSFGMAIFVNKLDASNLRLPAIYGFVISISVIFLGPVVGSWIDKSKRLEAAVTFLILQNLIIAATCLILVIHFLYLVNSVSISMLISFSAMASKSIISFLGLLHLG